MFHGTTLSKAAAIKEGGFAESTDGELGAGVYLVGEDNPDKAKRFAHDEFKRSGERGRNDSPAIIECELRIKESDIFFSDGGNKAWRENGFHACKASMTRASTSSEWCISRPETLRVVAVHNLKGNGCPYAPYLCPYEGMNARMHGSPWGGSCPCAISEPTCS
jgi:hypothetical protein